MILSINFSSGPLFKIRDEKQVVRGYLLGTLHYVTSEMLSFLESNSKIQKAWKKSSSLYIECLPATSQRAWELATQQEKSRIKPSHSFKVSEEDASQFVQNFLKIVEQRSFYPEGEKRALLDFINMELEYQDPEQKICYCVDFLSALQLKELGILEGLKEPLTMETRITQRFKKESKHIGDLETVEILAKQVGWAFRRSLFDQLPKMSVENYEKQLAAMKQKIESWKKGEIQTAPTEDQELLQISEERSHLMATKIDRVLRGQDVTWLRSLVNTYIVDTNWIIDLAKSWFSTPQKERKFFAFGRDHIKDVIADLKALNWTVEQI